MKFSLDVFQREDFIEKVFNFNKEFYPVIGRILSGLKEKDIDFEVFCLGTSLARLGIGLIFMAMSGTGKSEIEEILYRIIQLGYNDSEEMARLHEQEPDQTPGSITLAK